VSKDPAPWELLYPILPNDPPETYDQLHQKVFPRIPLGSPGALLARRAEPVLASIEHVSKYRLHVEPYGDRFAVFDGEELKTVCVDRVAARMTMKQWQRHINAEKEPDWHIVAGRELDEIYRDFERRKAFLTPADHGHDGGTKTQRNRIEPPWRGYVREQIVVRRLTAASNADIYASFKGRGPRGRERGGRWTFVGRKCPGRSVFMEFLKQLRKDGTLPPNS
jgi:hypothetical protein